MNRLLDPAYTPGPEDRLLENGDVFEWRGLPGDYDYEIPRFIRVGTMTARCEVNTAILLDLDEDPVSLSTIGLADLEVAIRLGFLVKVQR